MEELEAVVSIFAKLVLEPGDLLARLGNRVLVVSRAQDVDASTISARRWHNSQQFMSRRCFPSYLQEFVIIQFELSVHCIRDWLRLRSSAVFAEVGGRTLTGFRVVLDNPRVAEDVLERQTFFRLFANQLP